MKWWYFNPKKWEDVFFDIFIFLSTSGWLYLYIYNIYIYIMIIIAMVAIVIYNYIYRVWLFDDFRNFKHVLPIHSETMGYWELLGIHHHQLNWIIVGLDRFYISYITALTAGWCFATCANSPIWNDNLDWRCFQTGLYNIKPPTSLCHMLHVWNFLSTCTPNITQRNINHHEAGNGYVGKTMSSPPEYVHGYQP